MGYPGIEVHTKSTPVFLTDIASVETGGGHSSTPPREPSSYVSCFHRLLSQLCSIAILSEAVLKVEQNPFPPSFDVLGQTMDYLVAHMDFFNRFIMANRFLFEPLILR